MAAPLLPDTTVFDSLSPSVSSGGLGEITPFTAILGNEEKDVLPRKRVRASCFKSQHAHSPYPPSIGMPTANNTPFHVESTTWCHT